MKKILILTAIIFLLAIQFASASMQILNLTDKNAVHNSILPIQFALNNTGAAISDVTLAITNMSNSSQIFPITITDISKLSIAANGSQIYTLNYAVPKYLSKGIYLVSIFALANQSATPISASKAFNIAVNETPSIDLPEVVLTTFPGRNITSSFTITNDGNVNLSAITFTPLIVMNDTNNRTIKLSLPNLDSLAAGQSKVVNFNVSIPENQKVKSYSTTVKIQASGDSFNLNKNVTFTINLEKKYCKIGNVC